MKWFTRWLSRNTHARPARTARRARPTVEALEDRQVPTVTYHGGALLQHVEVQGLYLGADWYNSSTLYQQTGQVENYLHYIVNSPYLDMLTNAGYSVGRGSFDGGRIGLANINKSYYLTDGQIQSYLQGYINSGALKTPDSNRLYVIYVEPGVAVSTGFGTSINDFLGYHSAFRGSDGHGHSIGIAYAVIPYQAGINGHDQRVSTFGSTTEVTSHELAEAVTDPLTNGRQGWFDDAYARTHGGEGEIGDIVAGQIVNLNGYVVQKEAGKNDQALSPTGATAIGRSSPSPATTFSASGSFALSSHAAGAFFQSSSATGTNSTTPGAAGTGSLSAGHHEVDAVFLSGGPFANAIDPMLWHL